MEKLQDRARQHGGFNATTAFLLPFLGSGSTLLAAVSMPPRRSCFAVRQMNLLLALFGFNATTAFLLLDLTARSIYGMRGFNATTAFLLRQTGVPNRVSKGRFNATTAFLLPTAPAAGAWPCWWVSMPPRRSCFWIGRRDPHRAA